MALDELTVVAEPSPAAAEVDAPAESHAIPVVEELSGKGREKWLKEPADYPRPPKRQPKVSSPTDKAESSPAEAAPKLDEPADSSPAPSAEKPEVAETAAEPAPAEPTQVGKQPSEAEKRIKSLLSEAKLLKQKLAQYEQPAPAAAAKPTQPAEAAKDLQRPDPTKFETMDAYFEALSDYKVEKALQGERQRVAEAAQKSAQETQVKAEREQWNSKIGEARKKYTDFDSIALNPDLPIPANSAIDWWVMNRPNGAEVLYYFGQHPDQIEALHAMPAHQAAYELARIEMEVTAATDPKPATPVVSKAPRPPSEANPKGKVDPLAAALQAGDFASYRRLKDAEERGKRS